MSLQFLLDGLIAGSMIGLGRHRRDADLFDPAVFQLRPWRFHGLGRLCHADACRPDRRAFGAVAPDGPACPSAGR